MADSGYRQLRALIVDDFDSFRLTVTKMLQDLGIQSVESASSGRQALQLCKQGHFDLVLCDYNLGRGKTGQQVLEELRYYRILDPASVFIMISAESSKSIVMAAYDYEPDAYLTKPITSKTLQQRLRRLLAQREVTGPIHRAIERGEPDTAIALCRKQVITGGRSTTICQKLLGQIYLDNGHLAEAESLYRDVLEVRQLDWAMVGMARAKKAQGDLLSALHWLEEVIEMNPLCMKAYDLQAEIFREQGEQRRVQSTLQRAVEMSPRSILRQQNLGEVASLNNDVPAAAEAYRHTVRLGENSCYDRLENHLGFGRATAELFAEDPDLAKRYAREALKSMGELEQRFDSPGEREVDALLIQSQLYAGQGDKNRAEQLLSEAREATEEKGMPPDQERDMELVKAFRAAGQDEQAKELLDELLERYANDEAALEKLDRLLEEPVSAKNRELVAGINKQGIAHYEAGEFGDAVRCFNEALQAFPNHIGVRLNLAQALVDSVDQDAAGDIGETLATARQVLDAIEVLITTGHAQFQRYRQLRDKFMQAERDLKTKGESRE